MGNFRDRMKKEIKQRDGEAAKPKPPSAAPLVDGGQTRQVDMQVAAKAEAAIAAGEASERRASGAPAPIEVADDEQVTAEVVVKPAPAAKPAEAAPAPAPAQKIVPLPVRKAPVAVVPAAPVEAAPEEAEAPKAGAPAPASSKPPVDMAALLDAVKAAVEEQLAPIKRQVEGLVAKVAEFGEALAGMQEAVTGNDETLNGFGRGMDELDEGLGTLKSELGTLKSTIGTLSSDVGGLKTAVQQNDGQVTKLGEAIDGFEAALFGENREAALAPFNGEPAIPLLLEQVAETGNYVSELVGENGERIPSLVDDNGTLTAKVFVVELIQQAPSEAKLVRIAKERGYDTSKDVLGALAQDEQFAIQVVGALKLAPSEKLDDPALSQVKGEVVAIAKAVSQRADIYYKRLDWNSIEAEWKQAKAEQAEADNAGRDE